MTILTLEADPLIPTVVVTSEVLTIALVDGKASECAVRLVSSTFPRLDRGT